MTEAQARKPASTGNTEHTRKRPPVFPVGGLQARRFMPKDAGYDLLLNWMLKTTLV